MGVVAAVEEALRGGARAALATTLTVLLGVGMSGGLSLALLNEQRADGQREFTRRADLVDQAVALEAGRYLETLTTVAAATGSFQTLTAAKFRHLTTPLRGMHLAGATSVAFLVSAPDDRVDDIAAFWRARGADGLVFHPVGTGREHFFTVFATSLGSAPALAPSVGKDVAQAPTAATALIGARASRQPGVSDTYQLLIDRDLPAAARQLSFVLVAPVFAPADQHGNEAFVGWVLMGMRGQDFMGATLARISQNVLDVTLSARNSDGTFVPVATQRLGSKTTPDVHRVDQVTVGNRSWHLRLQAHLSNLPGAGGVLPIVTGGAGAALSLLLGLVVFLLITRRDRAETMVQKATADLREQKTMLEAIMDSVADGIVVIDQDGDLLLTNRAAAPHMRVGEQIITKGRWKNHMQLLHLDGRTPLGDNDLPTVRALSGHSSHEVEMIRRQKGFDDVILSASARPLDGRAGRQGAVGVFRDVTERYRVQRELQASTARLSEELIRREAIEAELLAREAELTVFAGMVAHDLKAPLRAVAGFTEILREDLATALPDGLNADCADSMDRIINAAARMDRLINDLLSFATARDRTLHPEPVDLNTLVHEVIAETTGSGATGRNEPSPTIDVQALPTVHADPAMCRQLLDNLIGNALKYTHPNQPAQVQISAHPEEGAWVRIEIADRGVGIPAGKHEQVFVTFHREHAGYAGSGLGLAICQRIIERHGGTIAVTDNPGGGSRFFFTLPTTAPAGSDPTSSDGATVSAELPLALPRTR